MNNPKKCDQLALKIDQLEKILKNDQQPNNLSPLPQSFSITNESQSIHQELKQKHKNHQPQIIDEDTQHFRINLQHILNIFKKDAISQFMVMKRSMLQDQKEKVRLETARFLQMYQQKHNQLNIVRLSLQNSEEKNNKNWNIIDILSKQLCKYKRQLIFFKILLKYFNHLKIYQKFQKLKKREKIRACKYWERKLQSRVIYKWRRGLQQQVLDKREEKRNQKHKSQIEDIINKYQKQLNIQKQRLKETQKEVAELNALKNNMQQNLKRAFMRGVCALNFQAMNVLQGNNADPKQTTIQLLQTVTKFQNNPVLVHSQIQPTNLQQKKKEMVFYNNKIESKDHKWKDATVMGMNFVMKEEEECQPRGLPEVMHKSNQQQGKIIKVNNLGKSFLQEKHKKQNNQVSIKKK